MSVTAALEDPAPSAHPAGGSSLGAGESVREFRTSPDIALIDGAVPLTWWTYAPNIGDLLGPYLVRAMTGRPVRLVESPARTPGLGRFRRIMKPSNVSYLTIGSIINKANRRSIVWGSGSFGTETRQTIERRASYRAVRGPLTRNLLRLAGVACPDVYGDPALLMPMVFRPHPEKTYRVGLILRHSERDRLASIVEPGVALIDMRDTDVEGVISRMLECEQVIAASLHGLVLADAYGIPSAWLASNTPKGLEFKYHDYFLSVDKVRRPQHLDFAARRLSISDLEALDYDSRPIKFDHDRLLSACPLVDAWPSPPASS
jgi:hypothetical protein